MTITDDLAVVRGHHAWWDEGEALGCAAHDAQWPCAEYAAALDRIEREYELQGAALEWANSEADRHKARLADAEAENERLRAVLEAVQAVVGALGDQAGGAADILARSASQGETEPDPQHVDPEWQERIRNARAAPEPERYCVTCFHSETLHTPACHGVKVTDMEYQTSAPCGCVEFASQEQEDG
jgi:hypothetical protein